MSFLESLHARARVLDRKIVFPEGGEPRVLAAVATLVAEGLVRPVVLGPVDEVQAGLHEAGVDPSRVLVVDPSGPDTLERTAPLARERLGRGRLTEAESWERAKVPRTLPETRP